MLDQENILRSPSATAQDPSAAEPLDVVLGENGARRPGLILGAVISLVVAIVALGIWFFSSASAGAGFWGLTDATLVFWLSATGGMVVLSAIMRLTHASWRYPLRRILDLTSLFGILSAIAVMPMLGLVRVAIYGPLSRTYQGDGFPASDKVWEYLAANGLHITAFGADWLCIITAYLAGIFLLLLTARPDFAVLRERAPANRKALFTRLAGGWVGTTRDWRIMRWAEGFLVVAMVVTFFAAQTALGWDYQLGSGKEWDSSIYPFQTNIMALQSGVALLVLVMTVLRGRLRNPALIGDKQYDALGKLMIALGLLFFYFRWCDYITAWYGHQPSEWPIQMGRTDEFPVAFVLTILGCILIPIFANIFRQVRTSPLLLSIVSIFLLVGDWCQRFLDTTPTFDYRAMPVDGAAILGGLAAFVGVGALFLLALFWGSSLFSSLSWWGLSKWRSRSSVRTFGNTTVTVMVEDPPVWEN